MPSSSRAQKKSSSSNRRLPTGLPPKPSSSSSSSRNASRLKLYQSGSNNSTNLSKKSLSPSNLRTNKKRQPSSSSSLIPHRSTIASQNVSPSPQHSTPPITQHSSSTAAPISVNRKRNRSPTKIQSKNGSGGGGSNNGNSVNNGNGGTVASSSSTVSSMYSSGSSSGGGNVGNSNKKRKLNNNSTAHIHNSNNNHTTTTTTTTTAKSQSLSQINENQPSTPPSTDDTATNDTNTSFSLGMSSPDRRSSSGTPDETGSSTSKLGSQLVIQPTIDDIKHITRYDCTPFGEFHIALNCKPLHDIVELVNNGSLNLNDLQCCANNDINPPSMSDQCSCSLHNGSAMFMCLTCIYWGCESHYLQHSNKCNHPLCLDLIRQHVYCVSCKEHHISHWTSKILASLNTTAVRGFSESSHVEITYLSNSHLITPQFSSVLDCGVLGLRGMINLGNTCFMSVILQCLANNPYLRRYYLSGTHLDNHHSYITSHLQQSLYDTRIRREKKKATKNRDQKIIDNLKPTDMTVDRSELSDELTKQFKSCVACKMNELFQEMYCGITKHPIDITSFMYDIWQRDDCDELAQYSIQQDSHELFMKLLSLLHSALVQYFGSEEDRSLHNFDKCTCVIHQIFSGKFQSSVICSECKHESPKDDPFLDVCLHLRYPSHKSPSKQSGTNGGGGGGSHWVYCKTLYECLSHFVASEKISYRCEKCSNDRGNSKKLVFKELPKYLCLHLKRFEDRRMTTSLIDSNMNHSNRRSPDTNANSVNDNIHMTPSRLKTRRNRAHSLSPALLDTNSTATSSSLRHKNRKSNASMTPQSTPVTTSSSNHNIRGNSLNASYSSLNGANSSRHNNHDKIETLITFPIDEYLDVSKFMFGYNGGSHSHSHGSSGSAIDDRNDKLRKGVLYDLKCVVVHTGNLTNGHYICYVKKGDYWYVCDDDIVYLVDTKQVRETQAYMLFYEQIQSL